MMDNVESIGWVLMSTVCIGIVVWADVMYTHTLSLSHTRTYSNVAYIDTQITESSTHDSVSHYQVVNNGEENPLC